MEELKHECGIAMVRLRKPLSYYEKRYGSASYGLDKMYLLMEKQRNRGQEGAGIAYVRLTAEPGEDFMFRERAEGAGAIQEVFSNLHSAEGGFIPGELYMGHLRYSTTGRSGLSYVHPFMRRNNFRSRNLAVCGNFNLTNIDDIFRHIAASGQHPRQGADTFLLLEQLGHRLDMETERLFQEAKDLEESYKITSFIEENIKIENILKLSAPYWDGGYVICGITGSGESFMLRDPWGIRPAFYYTDDETITCASERAVIQTAMNVSKDSIAELEPGCALIVSQNGDWRVSRILPAQQKRACSFERIYFSRGGDADIYTERKALGRNVAERALEAVDGDLKHTVVSFIPNTAEVACYGLTEALNDKLNTIKAEEIASLGANPQLSDIEKILSMNIRSEKVAIKDVKLRTFISEGTGRDDLAAHVYDVTYGTITPGVDNLMVIDDSIVRGTTLKQSVVRILSRLQPKRLVIVSSAPQIRYPDFYGIDMSTLDSLIAFKAAVALLHDESREYILDEVYEKCKRQERLPATEQKNYVKEIYNLYTDEQISSKIAELITPSDINIDVKVVFQNLEGLHNACPNHTGDWYFSGDYPTAGGMKMLNKAYISYFESITLFNPC